MSRLTDLISNAERLDAQRREIEDISDRARATGTHIHDQWNARLDDLARQARGTGGRS